MTDAQFKGDWHLALGLIFSATAVYNLMRLCSTHAARNAVNVVIYGTLTGWELRQARQHWTNADGDVGEVGS